MAKIQGFRIRNFRALKDITLGKLWNTQKEAALSNMTVVIGKNGVGKSTIFDAFGFLSDCLKSGVEEACDMHGRGGFQRLLSKGGGDAIEFEIYYKEDGNARPITYELSISLDNSKRPYVSKERLRQRRKGQSHGQPYSFLHLENGKGLVWKGENTSENYDELTALMDGLGYDNSQESNESEIVELEDKRRLGIATLGSLKQHSRISAFRQFIEGWYLSYFTPDAARSLPMAGPQKHLNRHGDNLGNVVQYLERENPKKFQSILNRISEKIPGIQKITTERTEDGRLLLKFNDKGFIDPFFAQQMSDGTLKVFAYMLLLEDPNPPPFICIEEPENGLYHKLLEPLAREFREHTTSKRESSQIFITTHQPYFVDALLPEEVWVLEKGDDGFSKVSRVSNDALVTSLVKEELPLGGLWYSDYLKI